MPRRSCLLLFPFAIQVNVSKVLASGASLGHNDDKGQDSISDETAHLGSIIGGDPRDAPKTTTTVRRQLSFEPLDDCLQYEDDDMFLPGSGVRQELGTTTDGRVPDSVVREIRVTICTMNSYYLRTVRPRRDDHDGDPTDRNGDFLARNYCINRQSKCAFWASPSQGQCANDEYKDYMETECPLACQRCDNEVLRARALNQYLQELSGVYYQDRRMGIRAESERMIVNDRERTLSKLMTDVGMDPSVIGNLTVSGNFAERLNNKIMALVPRPLSKLYTSASAITDEEAAFLHKLVRGASPAQQYTSSSSRKRLLLNSRGMGMYRERGYMVRWMERWFDLITRPMQLLIGFAIPNQEALEAIRDLEMPIVEMGAGTGYWTAQLRLLGVHVIAHDKHGPNSTTPNEFFDVWYTNDIREGTCLDVFRSLNDDDPQQKMMDATKNRALLLIWPNDPDPVDNRQFCHTSSPVVDECEGSQPVWDADCLRAYLEAGGSTVIYIGERERVLRQRYETAEECGLSSTRKFQRMLEQNFDLHKIVPIPNLWLNDDDMTIWIKKNDNSNDESSAVDQEL